MKLQLGILLLGVLNFASTKDISIIKNFSRTWLRDGFPIDIYGSEPFTKGKDNVHVYHYSEMLYDEILRNYTINYEFMDIDGIVYIYKCFHQHKTSNEKLLGYPSLRSNAGKQVLITYVDGLKEKKHGHDKTEVELKHRMIDMSTCQYTEIKDSQVVDLSRDREEEVLRNRILSKPDIIPFQNGAYEMFIYGRDSCGAARCRRIVNSDGTIEKELVSYLPMKYLLKRIRFYQTKSPNDYFAVVDNYTGPQLYSHQWVEKSIDLTLLYASPDGKIEELLNLEEGRGLYEIDGTEKYLTACWSKNSEFRNVSNLSCIQYDSNGIQIINETFMIPYDVYTVGIKNLENGGFLLLTQECKSDEIEKNRCLKGGLYYIRYIKPGDFFRPAIEIEGFNLLEYKNYIDPFDTFISYQDKENVCISIFIEGVIGSRFEKKFFRKCISAEKVMKNIYDQK